jgi:hypothetical protein
MKNNQFKQLMLKLQQKFKVTKKELIESVAKATGFIKRSSSKISGWDFFQLMTIEHFSDASISLEGLCDVLHTMNPQADLSAQALHQRIISESAVSFLEEVFSAVYKKFLSPVTEKISLPVFNPFGRVFLQDSTQMSLHEDLAQEFKGSGGGASKSSLKIDLIYELKHSILEKLTVSKGTIPDQKRAGQILDIIRKGDLIIRDLGYSAIDVFSKIAEKKAYYLSRFKHGTSVYLGKDETESVDLLELIKKKMNNNVAEMTIFFRKAETLLPYGRLSCTSSSC